MAEQARLLVVDDDAEVRRLLGDYLGGQGYQVEGCADSTALRQSLAAQLPDLVLLDANPLERIGNTRRIAAVMLRGRLYQQPELHELMAAIQAMPDLKANDWLR